MTEYLAVCPVGHRDYLRLVGVTVDNVTTRVADCPKCGLPRLAHPLPAAPDTPENP